VPQNTHAPYKRYALAPYLEVTSSVHLPPKRRNRKKRMKKGITGIEAAIVMIAFVVVAAALAFVVLNMGMYTTQKAKEVIQKGLEGATSALQVDGTAAALVDSSGKVNFIAIPIKLAPGKQAVDLGYARSTVSIVIPDENVALENAYLGALYISGTYATSDNPAVAKAIKDLKINITYDNISNLNVLVNATAEIAQNLSINHPVALIVFIKSVKPDAVLQNGEKALVVVYLPSNYALGPYESINVEVRPPSGAPLTIGRTMPATLPTDSVITLG